jgi:uncharacterized protein YqjF (DUF2071 family)
MVRMATSTLLAPRATAPSRPLGYHHWHDLLFVHWSVPAETLADLVPRGLTLDTYADRAWIGLVAFRMSGVRPWWFPALWPLSAFPETNVRTYVRCGDEEPGVWFMSLDAARLLPVLVARATWHLNYFWARMSVARVGKRVTYRSRRIGRTAAHAHLAAEIDGPPDRSATGSLDHFLLERYVFYNPRPDGRLQQGRVRHQPYGVSPARLVTCEQSLLAAAGIETTDSPCHVAFSPGVDVEIVSLRDVD